MMVEYLQGKFRKAGRHSGIEPEAISARHRRRGQILRHFPALVAISANPARFVSRCRMQDWRETARLSHLSRETAA
jgi:hypothetical protein